MEQRLQRSSTAASWIYHQSRTVSIAKKSPTRHIAPTKSWNPQTESITAIFFDSLELTHRHWWTDNFFLNYKQQAEPQVILRSLLMLMSMFCVKERKPLELFFFWNVETWRWCVSACVTQQNVASSRISCEAGERNRDNDDCDCGLPLYIRLASRMAEQTQGTCQTKREISQSRSIMIISAASTPLSTTPQNKNFCQSLFLHANNKNFAVKMQMIVRTTLPV